MITILGYTAEAVPPRETLQSMLPVQWRAAWRAEHGAVRNDRRALESLIALCLLHTAHPNGCLCYENNGRPYFTERDVDFSIAHTGGAAFCAITSEAGARIGLDAERLAMGRVPSTREMAVRWLTSAELRAWESDPTDVCFLRIWTRKEAMIKRDGEGLRGLHTADSVKAQADGNVQFFEYQTERILVTLCCGAEERDVALRWAEHLT